MPYLKTRLMKKRKIVLLKVLKDIALEGNRWPDAINSAISNQFSAPDLSSGSCRL